MHNGIEISGRHLAERPVAKNPRVADDGVEAAEGIDCSLYSSGCAVIAADVGVAGNGRTTAASDLGRDLIGRRVRTARAIEFPPLSFTTTLAPALARTSAWARPRPRPPPVTSTTRARSVHFITPWFRSSLPASNNAPASAVTPTNLATLGRSDARRVVRSSRPGRPRETGAERQFERPRVELLDVKPERDLHDTRGHHLRKAEGDDISLQSLRPIRSLARLFQFLRRLADSGDFVVVPQHELLGHVIVDLVQSLGYLVALSLGERAVVRRVGQRSRFQRPQGRRACAAPVRARPRMPGTSTLHRSAATRTESAMRSGERDPARRGIHHHRCFMPRRSGPVAEAEQSLRRSAGWVTP